MTAVVVASEFSQNFDTYQHQAQREPIQVCAHGQTAGYFISSDVYEAVLAVSRQAYHPSELPSHLREAIRTARVDPRHDHLNALMEPE